MSSLKIAVIGAGHLGRIHTRLAGMLDNAQLVGIVEPNAAARGRVCEEFQTQGWAHHREMLDQIDAAVVAAPTQFHHSVALDLLAAGKHVLLEKPITSTVAEAEQLVATARRQDLVLAVGHVERFNPALDATLDRIGQVKYIEAARTSGYTFRSTDVGAVLDLMIHDLDVALALAGCEVVDVQALGLALFGPHEDMVQARLTFADGCVANLTASRMSFVAQRWMQIYSDRGYAGIDFGARQSKVVCPKDHLQPGTIDIHALSADECDHIRQHLFSDEQLLPLSEIEPPEGNPLLAEQQDFCNAILHGRAPRVTGEDGLHALQVAQRIIDALEQHQWDGHANGRIGPHLRPVAEPPAHLQLRPGDEIPRRKAG